MTMTVGELRDMLDGVDDMVEVRLAHQPGWAFEYSINRAELVYKREALYVGEEEVINDHADDYDTDEPPTVYLVEGEQIGYLPGYVANAIGW